MQSWLSCVIIGILLLVQRASAHIASCGGACELSLNHLVFPDVDANLDYYPTQCGSRLRIVSVFACMRWYCRPAEILAGWKELNHDCKLYGNITIPSLDSIADISDDSIAQWPRFDIDQFRQASEFNQSVLPDRGLFDLAFRTKNAWNNSVTTRDKYGNAMFCFWIIAIAIRLGNRFFQSRSTAPSFVTEKTRHDIANEANWKYRNLLQCYLTVPATFSGRCSEPVGWCTIPPRLQALVLLVFAIINIVLCCINYDVFEDNLYFSVTTQWARYIADRTGVISTANLPLIWLFATRNNIVLYTTGWSFDTAMQFHRWVARISTIEAVIHSIAYTIVSLESGWSHYWSEWEQRYWTMGALATVVMCLLCAFSLYPMRNYYYELFLLLHIGLGILTLLGMWYHVEIFSGAYDWYLWPCLILWVMDRMARVCRLAYLNFPFRASSLHHEPSSDLIWLSIPSVTKRKPKPGEHYFLYVLHNRTFYESHPFTLSSWAQETNSVGQKKQQLNFLIRPYDGFTRRLVKIANRDSNIEDTNQASSRVWALAEGPYGPSHNLKHLDSLVFVVGGSGVAVALAYLTDLCGCMRRKSATYQAQHFRIIWAVQHQSVFEHIYQQEIRDRLDQITANSEQIIFDLDIYVTRSESKSDILRGPKPSKILIQRGHDDDIVNGEVSDQRPLLFSRPQATSTCTSCSSTIDPTSYSSTTYTNSDTLLADDDTERSYVVPNSTTLNLHSGKRPNIPALVAKACQWQTMSEQFPQDTDGRLDTPLSRSRASESCIGIICCGPAALADATRASVVKVLGSNPKASIEFWNESYTW